MCEGPQLIFMSLSLSSRALVVAALQERSSQKLDRVSANSAFSPLFVASSTKILTSLLETNLLCVTFSIFSCEFKIEVIEQREKHEFRVTWDSYGSPL